jgi:TraY domain
MPNVAKSPRRVGRPIKPPVSGERVGLSLRVTADMKRKLEAAALESGRSLGQEAELRLERSFEIDLQSKLFEREFLKQRKALAIDLSSKGIKHWLSEPPSARKRGKK